MTSLEEFIEGLPGDLQPWAKLWLPTMMGWSEDHLTEWMTLAARNWTYAYESLVGAMDTDQKITELKLKRAAFEQLNRDNGAFMAAQRRTLFSILSKALLAVNAA